ncbi:MAG: PAS domain-containing sensor histidine kinase [Candidatus Bathyarchaeia archaeon]
MKHEEDAEVFSNAALKELGIRSEEFRRFFANFSDGVAISKVVYRYGKPVDYVILEINDAYERILGVMREDFVGQRITKSVPGIEKDPSDPIAFYGRVATTEKQEKFEIYFSPFKKYYQITAFSPKKGFFIAIFSDITQQKTRLVKEETERKQAEESLKEAQTKLREYTSRLEKIVEERTNQILESEQKYRELYESFGEAFIAFDWDLNVIHWNKVAERVTATLAENALGKKIYKVLPEFLSVDVTPYLEKLKKNKPTRFMMNVTSRETKKPSIFEISAYPSKQGVIIIIEDKTLEEQTKRLSAIGATAGMVGHDIRNPLQSILSDTYLLKEELTSMPECKVKEGVAESIDSIETNINYINKIVQDLQDYSRPITPEYSEVDLPKFLEVVFENIAIPDSIKLEININHVKNIQIDPLLLQRAFTNLVTNAIQAMPNGGNLKITIQTNDNATIIAVSDTGVGIPDEIKQKLFNPMITTKAKGQGFGLAVTKRLIELMKGSISFESEKGKGTTFTIILPK